MKLDKNKNEKSSIRIKLRKISIINSAVILLLCWLLLTSTSLLFIKRYEKRNLELIAATLSNSLTAATVFEDSYDAHKKIATLGNEGMFASAKLVTDDQTVLVDWQDQQQRSGWYQNFLREWIYARPFSVNIVHAENTVGTLTLVGTVTGAADFIRYSVMILTSGMLCVLIVASLLSALLHRGILVSLRNITSSIHYVIRSGDFSLRIPESPTKEFQLFSEDLNSLLAEMQSLQTSLLRDNRSLAAKALEDPLTGLANRAAFVARLTTLLDAQLAQERFVLLFLDGDRFKSINDNWGHAAGDEVLRAIGSRLLALAYKQDLVARLGGDEFAMLITSRATESQLQQLTEEIRETIAQKIMIAEGTPITTSVTIGFAWSQHGDSVESILERADMNMYKNKGINKVRI
ncbi:diguanylate cyclase domain-containing protein [Candidatus Pantoea formicae]|uniref:diguanylate cyclase n=1 Tax=Candidatus Pantoea formicae TaxID=2608355 RepID=A0ABX0QS29_9GAMM|nr:diguanylate cyclase [Pantoea formicae]MDF7652006.1 diguanylate cyclase [Erwiniaceae bacterium L1_54_3]NIE99160.1 diguanylate cyclase [Pantoea formicae]